jgi:hypothetical protein
MEQLGSQWTDFREIWLLSIFRKTVKKYKIPLQSDKSNRYFTWRPIYIFILSRSVLLRLRNVPDTIFEKIKTHILCSVTSFPPSENRAVYEIMWENIVERCRPQITIWRMRIACWIPKATNKHSEYVITIAFPPQKSLHERASVLRYTGCST